VRDLLEHVRPFGLVPGDPALRKGPLPSDSSLLGLSRVGADDEQVDGAPAPAGEPDQASPPPGAPAGFVDDQSVVAPDQSDDHPAAVPDMDHGSIAAVGNPGRQLPGEAVPELLRIQYEVPRARYLA